MNPQTLRTAFVQQAVWEHLYLFSPVIAPQVIPRDWLSPKRRSHSFLCNQGRDLCEGRCRGFADVDGTLLQP